MTPEEAQKLQKHITGIAEILYKNTPKSELVSLETIEKSVRQQMLDKVSPQVAFFLSKKLQEQTRDEPGKSKVVSERFQLPKSKPIN